MTTATQSRYHWQIAGHHQLVNSTVLCHKLKATTRCSATHSQVTCQLHSRMSTNPHTIRRDPRRCGPMLGSTLNGRSLDRCRAVVAITPRPALNIDSARLWECNAGIQPARKCSDDQSHMNNIRLAASMSWLLLLLLTQPGTQANCRGSQAVQEAIWSEYSCVHCTQCRLPPC
jgi:hypothetical protein